MSTRIRTETVKTLYFIGQTALLTLLGLVLVNVAASVILWSGIKGGAPQSLLSMEERDAFSTYERKQEFFSELRRLYDQQYRGKVYEPFALWKEAPFQGDFISISDSGYRGSHPSRSRSAKSEVRIGYFGGSSMFSAATPDSDTIPVLISEILAKSNPPIHSTPLNFGIDGHLSTQELARFLTLIIDGDAPDIAVFYHGVNDLYLGAILNQPHTFYERFVTVLDRKANLIEFGIAFATKLPIVKLLGGSRISWPVLSDEELRSRLDRAANKWRETAILLQSIGDSRGIPILFVLQPDIFSSHKQLTNEEHLLEKGYPDSLRHAMTWGRTQLRTSAPPGVTIFDCGRCVDKVSGSTFIDFVHITSPGNRAVAREIAPLVRRIIHERPHNDSSLKASPRQSKKSPRP